jgi:hypothetical protein
LDPGNDSGSSLIERPSYIEIEEIDRGVMLLHYDKTGRCIADTWHGSLDEAKRQAAFEFSTKEEDWVKLP